jgi:hypothetical protein
MGRSQTSTIVACALLTLALPRAVAQTEHIVPQGGTIQPAIDLCNPGDVVTLTGTSYTGGGNRNLDFHGKAITVRSLSDDPANCYIDCESSANRGFWFHSGESATSVVRGRSNERASSGFRRGRIV